MIARRIPRKTPTDRVLRAALVLFVAAASLPALATNGMYLAGYGSEAGGRAGANIAVADRALGLQSNPAGIGQLQGNHFSVDLQMLMPSLHFRNVVRDFEGNPVASNDLDGENRTFFMPSFAYVRGGKDTKWTWGIGLVSQGGMGATFKGMTSAFGTSDQTYSQVRFMTVIPTVAYSFTPDVSIGLSANVGWSDLQFRFWPQTSFYSDSGTPSDPSDDIGFFGPNLRQAVGTYNFSARAGVLWRVDSRWQLGAVYQTKTSSDYDDGKMDLDMSAMNMGIVTYDAKVGGFTWPEQYGIGVQFRPADRWVLAFDVKRYLWSDAVSLIEVKGTNSEIPAPMNSVTFPFVFNWKDQTIYALGGEFRLNDDVTLRAGYNYGKSPVPDETLNPLFPAIVEKHLTVGCGWSRGANTFNVAVERGFEATATNPNTDPNVNPFGPGASVDHSQWTISLGFSRAFGRH